MASPPDAQPFVPTLKIDRFQLSKPSHLFPQLQQERFTGTVIVQNPDDEFVSWQVHFGNGRIHYAHSAIGLMERCRYLLHKNALAPTLTLPPVISKEYEYFYQLWKTKTLTFEQSRAILEAFTREALTHILALPDSKCYLSLESDLPAPLLNLDIEPLLLALRHKIRCWHSLKPQINSPFQRPLVHDWHTVETWLKDSEDYGDRWLTQLHQSLKNLNCVYDIAYHTQTAVLELSILFGRLLKMGQITMLPYQEITLEERAHIVYIDENPGNQRIVSYTLQKCNFRVTCITDPCHALVTLQGQKVDLVLIKAIMREISGFQLTQLCRQTPNLEKLPIVLITEDHNLIHSIKAKMSGATGYFSKPFLPQELLATVENYLSSPMEVNPAS